MQSFKSSNKVIHPPNRLTTKFLSCILFYAGVFSIRLATEWRFNRHIVMIYKDFLSIWLSFFWLLNLKLVPLIQPLLSICIILYWWKWPCAEFGFVVLSLYCECYFRITYFIWYLHVHSWQRITSKKTESQVIWTCSLLW